MKTLLAIILALALASCGPAPESWKGTPNPLDTPAGPVIKRPPSAGVFGPPFGRFEGY